MQTNSECPCDTCVSCACCAVPPVDSDGLCVSCGGTPLAIAQQCPSGVSPHRSPDVTPAEGAAIDRVIADAALAQIAEEMREETDLSLYGSDPEDV